MKNTDPRSAVPSSATGAADDVATVIPNTSSSSDGSVGKASSNSLPGSLRALNRASYKISKPLPRNPNPNPNQVAEKLVATPEVATSASGSACAGGPPYQPQPQPPVYNIDKNDFRDVVQKLTGSPAHSQIRQTPAELPLPHPPRPCSTASLVPLSAAPTSRLHRIRPPPLADLTLRSPPPLVPVLPLPAMDPWTRPLLSPLPPLPTVSAAAESPISAYMRHLRGGSAGLPLYAPSSTVPPMLQPPSSPLGFGCLLSVQTAYQMMMAAPGLQLPTSPGVHVPSPRFGDP
ncbi:VQ motif-containing protein 9-like [Curcuma longa]|uniref:VQ motif-containing protein 9-like n=1 Tax=Curcuma longa TaxID=136217 RepID=UPI003D9DF9A0